MYDELTSQLMNCKHGWQPIQQLEIEAKVEITGLKIRVDNLLYEVSKAFCSVCLDCDSAISLMC